MKVHSVIFYSNSLDVAKDFYINIIGLAIDYETLNFISFNVPGDDIKLGMKLHKEDREIPGSQTIFISVENIESLYQELKIKKCTFSKELTKEVWAYEFAVLDPDGNKLTFREI